MTLRKFIFLNPTEGFHEEQASTDELSLGKVTAVGVGGIAFDASSQRIVNVATPTTGTDAANRDYVQQYVLGLDWKQSVRLGTAAALAAVTPAGTGVGHTLTANANGALSVDGVAVVNGDRILVKDQVAADDNGIYDVTDAGSAGTPFVLTRSTDADQAAEVTANLAMFVEEGTVNADTAWVLTTNNPIVVDTTNLSFAMFASSTSITAGAGLVKTGNNIDVELDTTANAQGAGTAGGSSGLEFDTAGAAGKLRAAVNATGGLQRSASGLSALLNGTTLLSGASGLSVKGLPLNFEINTVATSSNVTAANLNTLTAGTNSYADALHAHRNHLQQWTVSANVASGVGVYISGNNTVATGAANVDAQARVIGVTTASATTGNPVDIVVNGVVTGALSGATANVPYYLSQTGTAVVYGTLTGGDRTIRLGFAKNATDLEVRILDYGKKS